VNARMIASSEPPWQARFRLPSTTIPIWARDQPDQLLYASDVSGVTQFYRYDMSSGRRRQVTRGAGGVAVAAISPDGTTVWWFGDEHGSEHGTWRFTDDNGAAITTARHDAGNAAGVALGRDMAIIGTVQGGESTISVRFRDGTERVVFRDSSRCIRSRHIGRRHADQRGSSARFGRTPSAPCRA
jgi:hypothetical protein